MANKSQLIGNKWTHAMRKRERHRGKNAEKFNFWDEKVKTLWIKYQRQLEIEQERRNY
jgi:hypothetical protein